MCERLKSSKRKREKERTREDEREKDRGREDKKEAKKVAERSWSCEGLRFPLESDVPNPSGSTYR